MDDREYLMQIGNSIETMRSDLNSLRERLVIVERDTKSLHYRVDGMTGYSEVITTLSVNSEHTLEIIKDMQCMLKKQDKRLDELEKAEGNRAAYYWKLVFGAILTTVVGFVLGFIFKGGKL